MSCASCGRPCEFCDGIFALAAAVVEGAPERRERQDRSDADEVLEPTRMMSAAELLELASSAEASGR